MANPSVVSCCSSRRRTILPFSLRFFRNRITIVVFVLLVLLLILGTTTATSAFSYYSPSTSTSLPLLRRTQPVRSLLLVDGSSSILHHQELNWSNTKQFKAIRSLPWLSSSSLITTRRLHGTTINGGEGTTKKPILQKLTLVSGLASAVSWIVLSIVALRYHPDPKFAHCSLQHNLLTMSQAFAFPLPVLLAGIWTVYHQNDSTTTQRRLQLGLAATFAYNFVSFVWAPAFACGYDLYSTKLKAITGSIFAISSFLYWLGWKRSTSTTTGGTTNILQQINQGLWSIAPKSTTTKSTTSAAAAPLFATATLGYLWFTIQPIVTEYPLMTIPTILGKRLSRPASAYTFLGAIMSYCLKEKAEEDEDQQSQSSRTTLWLKRGLGIGSGLHILLVLLKLIGIDDGGLLLPGNGLWEVYPAMMAVPFATLCSLLVHFMALVGTITM